MFGINVDPGQKKGAAEGSKHEMIPKKPELRGFLMRNTKHNFIGAFTFMFTMALAWKFGVAQKRKRTYIDFYENYDARADFERMKRVGVFHSVNKDGSVGST